MHTDAIIVARVQPGTSKGITDLLLPQPSSGLTTLAVPLVGLSEERDNKGLRSRSLLSKGVHSVMPLLKPN